MRYGVPYMGGKNAIAEDIVDFLPQADTLIDLFAGGCGITDCAMRKGKYKNYIVNDIDDSGIRCFVNAINGKYKDEKRWISREDFFALKDTDPYVKLCWSFGNGGESYLYSREIEPYKKALHEMIFAETPYERKVKYRAVMSELKKYLGKTGKYICGDTAYSETQELQQLQNLERLENLRCVESLESLESYNFDYQSVQIPQNAVIYCDIPYKGTNKYGRQKFDYDRFYDWAEQQDNIFISEYDMPTDRFECVWQKDKRVTLCATNNKLLKTEKIFIPRRN